jgi:hypothetical protein
MKTFTRNLTVFSFLVALIVAFGVHNVQAFEESRGHRFAADAKLIASLDLSSTEKTALQTAVKTYGPAVKSAHQAFHAALKQLKTDLEATPPVGATLATDAATLAGAKANLKTARTALDSALNAALTPAHLTQLQNELTTQFQNRLAAKTDRLLFGYAMYLNRQ